MFCLMRGYPRDYSLRPREFCEESLIVPYRSLVIVGCQQVEDKTSIHIPDVQTMAEAFSREL